jgi:hypothetical protein
VFLDGQVVSCLAWASAAWKLKARDRFIGWDESTKQKNLPLIANNTRFLILPWIRVKYLASKALSLSLSRFEGTCYRAANWRYVGQTRGSAKKGTTPTSITVTQRPSTSMPCTLSSGAIYWMTRDEAQAILALPHDKAIHAILERAEKAETYDRLIGDVSPTTPSGMIPASLKPPPARRRKGPGRKAGHEGVSRIQPEAGDHVKEHTLERCPDCHTPLKEPIKHYTRYIEDIPPVEKPEGSEHTVHGYWCPQCKKIVFAPLTDALPNAMVGLRLVLFTAWLHYLLGVSVTNIVRILSVVCRFQISAGGVPQAWKNLSLLLEPLYHELGNGSLQARF